LLRQKGCDPGSKELLSLKKKELRKKETTNVERKTLAHESPGGAIIEK